MKMISILFFGALSFYSAGTYANIMIAPTRMEVGLEKSTTESFVVMNTSAEKMKMAVLATSFDTKGDNKYDISKYISINPKMISLNPNQSRTVRVTLRPDEELRKGKGEYYARILFKTVEKEQRKVPKKTTEQKNTVSMDIDLVFNVSIPVYASLGKGTPEMKADCVADKNGVLTVKVTNSGLWRFDGNMILYAAAKDTKKAELSKERLLMLRNNSKDIEVKLKAADLTGAALPIDFVSTDEKNKVKVLSNSCPIKQLVATAAKTVEKTVEKTKGKTKGK